MKIQLIIFIIMLLMGGLQALYRAYQKKKIQLDAERIESERRDAILRTGRDPLAEQAVAMQRQSQRDETDLMAQRQEALRQLRQQQESANQGNPQPVFQPAGNSGGGGGSGPITRELWPGGPVIVINGPAPTPQSQPQPGQFQRAPQPRPQEQRRPAPQMQPSRAQPVLRNKKQQRQQQQQPQRQQEAVPSSLESRQEARHDAAYYQRERALAKMQASSNIEERAAAVEPVFTRPSTPQQWRHALIAAEILGAPVSMRDPETAPGGPSH